MTLSRLLLSNIRELRSKYLSFLASSAFSVLIFYLLASFVMHPDVVHGHISQAQYVIPGMIVCEWMISVFSFFFMWYSSTAFVRSRKREFGVFTLLGTSRSQLNRMLFLEHVVIGAVSLGAGIGLGTLLLKLMLMAMSRILAVDSPIRFALVPRAALLTAGVYTGLFLVISVFAMLSVRSSQIAQLVRAAQKPKALPRYSPWLAALSVLCLGTGYYLAWTASGRTLGVRMLPVVGIVSTGTYFLFTQLSAAVFRKMQDTPSFYYRSTRLLTVADLVFKMKENAQVLSAVALLSATVLTSIAAIYTASAMLLVREESANPQALTFAAKGCQSAELSEVVRHALEKSGLAPESEIALDGILASTGDRTSVLLIPETSYNGWAKLQGAPVIEIDAGAAVRLAPTETLEKSPESMRLTLGDVGGTAGFELTVVRSGWLPETNRLAGIGAFLVVDDGQAAEWKAAVPAPSPVAFMSYGVKEWQRCDAAFRSVKAQMPPEQLLGFSSRPETYRQRRESVSLTAFIGLFITTLFFMGAGSMLYARLFTELQEDQAKYSAMRKLGLSRKEISDIITRQILLLFSAPFAVGAAHCLFAFKALTNVLRGESWQYAAISIGVFLVMQATYFALTRKAYLAEIAAMS